MFSRKKNKPAQKQAARHSREEEVQVDSSQCLLGAGEVNGSGGGVLEYSRHKWAILSIMA